MKIHLHKRLNHREQDELTLSVVRSITDGAFMLIEWTLVIATLMFIGEATGNGLISQLALLLLPLIYVRTMTELSEGLEFEIWQTPMKRWQSWLTMFIHLAISLAIGCGVYFLAIYLAAAVAASALL